MHVETKQMEEYSINTGYYQIVQPGLVNLDLPSLTVFSPFPTKKRKRDFFGIITDLGDFLC